jgi:hypothetical protein
MKNQPTSTVTPVSDGLARHIGRIAEDAARSYPGGNAKADLAKGHPDFVKRFHALLDEMATERAEAMTFTEPEQLAVSILGAKNVFGIESVMRAWDNHPLPETVPIVPFSEEVLRQCADENKRGADWRLVWTNGLSLRQQEQIRGRNRKKQPCFDPDYTWWLNIAQDAWANQSIEAGYRFLDFNGRFASLNWKRQEDEIAKLGAGFERAEEQAVVEACLSIFMITKKRLLRDWYHWGWLLTSDGGRVRVGRFVENGFNAYTGFYSDDFDGYSYGDLRVVLSRKF